MLSRAQALHKLMLIIGVLFALLVAFQSHAQPLSHVLNVEISPSLKMIKGVDEVTFPSTAQRRVTFLLHRDLQVKVTSKDDTLTVLNRSPKSLYVEYGLQLGNVDNKVRLEYAGVIYAPVVDDETTGLISPEGVALFESTHWYPNFLGWSKKFDLTLALPADWRGLTAGQLVSTSTEHSRRRARFVSIYPQEEISVVAGRFHVYEITPPGGPKVEVYLRQADASLAQNFLSLIPSYISHFAQEIAPYPYSSFAVVENFWETGYAFPGFTLLGPTVIRLPFILNSSLPHEVLHNWWGNGVFVDYDKGNWCEGLTTYMADHWQQEVAGQDRVYRLKTLINYMDFVAQNPDKDFPVRQFRGRHSESSQAIGYGKTMMIFRMLELQFGKDLFRKALQDFYRENQFKKASFEELQVSFEKVTGLNLANFFHQWLDRTGAPELALGEVKTLPAAEGGFNTHFKLAQTQAGAYDLVVPLQWTLESGEEIHQVARLTEKTQTFSLPSRARPVKLVVDPHQDLFRKLYLEERPVTLSTVLGSPQVRFYLHTKDAGAQAFTQRWQQSLTGLSQLQDVSGGFQPHDQDSLVLVGDRPEFREFMRENLDPHSWSAGENSYQILGENYPWNDTSTVLVTRRKNNPTQSIVWVRWHTGNDPADWAGRLTHYGTFGVLVFQGRPNILKTTWPVTQSPLIREF